jgi:general stress protein 26
VPLSLNAYTTVGVTGTLKVIQALPGLPKPVTEIEVNDLLQSKLNIQIATIDVEGYPIIQSTWFLYEKDSGKIYVGTSKVTRKVQNIRRNSDKIYFSFLSMTRITHTKE